MNIPQKSALVICAHADDNILGPGGTLIKFAREGWCINTIIFSFGEGSHPHYKPELIRKIRIKEARKVNDFIGGRELVFLGLSEGRFLKEWDSQIIQRRLEGYIEKFKPDIIFTHPADDFHKDHKNVNTIVKQVHKRLRIGCPLYGFDVWGIASFKSYTRTKLVVDVSDTFPAKIKALNMFRSQKIQALIPLMLGIYLKAFFNGRRYKADYAEVFFRIR